MQLPSVCLSPLHLVRHTSEVNPVAAKRSYRVIATARKPERLEDLKKLGMRTMALDVTSSEEELASKAKEAWSI